MESPFRQPMPGAREDSARTAAPDDRDRHSSLIVDNIPAWRS